MSQKIVLIGAGSTEFTPGLIADLVASEPLRGSTIALVDLKPDALAIMAGLARRIVAQSGADLRIEASTDRREALRGATFVTVTIATGGAATWRSDIDIPFAHGVAQTVGDSVGPGGVFRALRHIPQLVGIARDMEELCPDAWLFNYTNPMSTLCGAVRQTSGIKSAGLCHGILETRHMLAGWLGVDHHDLHVKAAGVNHLCWVLDLRAHGVDLYPRLRELGATRLRDLASNGELAAQSFGDDPYDSVQPVSLKLMELYGAFPSPADRHVAEFFPFFLKSIGDSPYGPGRRLAYGLSSGLDLSYRIIDGKGDEWAQLRGQAAGEIPLDEELFEASREGERLVKIIEAIVGDADMLELAVNVPNAGYISNLPPEAIVEVPALIGGYGLRPLGMGTLPDGIATILSNRVRQQQLTIEAALRGDRELALQALLADPLTPSVEAAGGMLAAALDTYAQYLPQFGAP